MQKIIKVISFIAVCSLSFASLAQTPSPAQIEQFKKLPESQQRSLAQSMGVDYNMIKAQLSGGSNAGTSGDSPKTTEFQPRSSQSDPNTLSVEEQELLNGDENSNDGLKPFGYDIFANQPSTFAPNTDLAIPEGYMLGPGDKISIQIFGKENQDYEIPVNREGQIVLPVLGPFTVTGLSFTEFKDFLTNQIKAKMIGVNVVVGMASLRTMRIFILGEAYKPGSYSLSSLSTVTQAIFAAGGINDIGSLRKIHLKRMGKTVSTLDLYDLLINGDSSNDTQLQSGDVVFVESIGETIRIDGEVRRPAIYELIEGDTFASTLKMAGGLLPSAYAKSTLVERFNKSQSRYVINVDLRSTDNLNDLVAGGDSVHVKKTAEMFEKSITIIGAVTRPGKYQWNETLKITDLLPNVDSHILNYADLSYSLIIRQIDVAKNIEVHQFSLSKAISDPSSADNLVLKPKDKILIFSNVSKLSEESLDLDMLAYTKEELYEKERNLAQVKYKNKLFWAKFGEENSKFNTNKDEADSLELLDQSIAQLSGGKVEEEIDVRKLSLFSRQRLLSPIIQKLKRQGASGKAIQLVEVDGEVKFPGVYPLAINGKIHDLVLAAGGIQESAYLTRAELTRNVIEKLQVEKRSINIDLGLALKGDQASNILLTSKDRLNIHKIPAWTENHVVELRGEFVFPGKYTIRRGETVADIVRKAGGYTKFAYPQGSVFTRVKLQELEQQNLFKLASDLRSEIASKSLTDSSAVVNYSDTQLLIKDLTNTKPVGRLVIDLPRIMQPDGPEVFLEGGDVLYLPTKKNSINVIGQVQVTSSHIYDASISATDYISLSGGMKKRADEERVYIVSANGSIKVLEEDDGWYSSGSQNDLKPGDTVVVPLDGEYMTNLTLWSTATNILYNTAIAVAAVNGL
ncbi:SLBB domain-containing protein [Colwelliaceae bacterium BS250]